MEKRRKIQNKKKAHFHIWYAVVGAVAVVAVVVGVPLYNAFTEPPKETLQTGVSASVVLYQAQSAAPSQTENASPQTVDALSQAAVTPLPADKKIVGAERSFNRNYS